MLGFVHRLQTEWYILVFGLTTDCNALQAIVASQQQETAAEKFPCRKTVQMQLLPRKLPATGMLSVGLKALAVIGVHVTLLCPN